MRPGTSFLICADIHELAARPIHNNQHAEKRDYPANQVNTVRGNFIHLPAPALVQTLKSADNRQHE